VQESEIRLYGPVFDHRADAIMTEAAHAIVKAVADEGLRLVQANLAGSLQHPTGHYQSNVRIVSHERRAAITDGGIVYGPWLEGVGSRNATTRFKGYSSFRRARDELQRRAGAIANLVLNPFIRKVNE
jgi:hypothetical protein